MRAPTPANVQMTFARTYGIHQWPLPDGRSVACVSQATWGDFIASCETEDVIGQADYVLSPELITSAEMGLGEIGVNQTIIEGRVDRVKELTRHHPRATFLLGTAVFDPWVDKPRNATLFLQGGEEVGRTHKVTTLNKVEQAVLDQSARQHDIARPEQNILPIICSDLLGHPYIEEEKTLLVSGCWGTPSGHPGVLASPDHHLTAFLKLTVNSLSEQLPSLHTIIMADRVPQGSTAVGPFNFHAQRIGPQL